MDDSSIASLWWKLLLAAPCLIAVVIVGSRLGVEAWFLGMFLVLLSAACVLAGIVLGFVAFLARNQPARG